MRFPHRSLWLVSLALATATSSSAQCREWDQRYSLTGVNGTVEHMTMYDEGAGTALYAMGSFDIAGAVRALAIAAWNGSEWSIAFGDFIGLPGVRATTMFDDGSGPALYAGGGFSVIASPNSLAHVAKWNGTSWSGLAGSLNGTVNTLAVFDDGSGDALYVGGSFTSSSGGLNPRRVARWNGSSYSTLGIGMDASVTSLAVFDDGGGAALYAAGSFISAGGTAANYVAKWNGSSWSALGSGLNNTANVLSVFDDGTGAKLYAGGVFTVAGGSTATRIASWNGTSWSSLGSGPDNAVMELQAFDDGSGSALYAGGSFTAVGAVPASRIAKWNGSTWSALGTGTSGDVTALAVADTGSGARLFVGGNFITAGDITVNHVASWDGSAWAATSVGQGVKGGILGTIVHDDGSGAALYACGSFPSVGDISANNVARWNGSSWSALGSGITDSLSFAGVAVNALATFDDGSGFTLYAGGQFATAGGNPALHVARWNGTQWSGVGGGIPGSGEDQVYALAVFDDGGGPALYAGGGSDSTHRVWRWAGSSWTPLTMGPSNDVYELAVFDDGGGPALYVAGQFATAGGSTVNHIAKWNGTSWSGLAGGMSDFVSALIVHDDGTGPALYAGGNFLFAGGVSVDRIAKWNGTAWSAVGAGANNIVNAFTEFDDGSGPVLVATGSFTLIGGVTANRVAAWDGSTWSPLGSGLDLNFGYSLAVFDDGSDGAPDLYVGGGFRTAGGEVSAGFAEWHGCPPGEGYCFGDGLDPVVTAQCPCTNFGEPGHGCANSIFSSGARLIATGKKSPNTLLFVLSDVPNNNLATGFRNTTNVNPGGVVFGDGVRCQSGTLIRFGSHNTGSLGDAPNTWTSATDTVAPGLTRYYQVQYRNPSPAFCPPATFNISNGYQIAW